MFLYLDLTLLDVITTQLVPLREADLLTISYIYFVLDSSFV